MTPVLQNPEDRAREEIDAQLTACGWLVQHVREMNLSESYGIAVCEYPTLSGEADYMLFVDGHAIGVVEAKAEEKTLIGVEEQTRKYAIGCPSDLACFRNPLPFTYESTGVETQFTNWLDPEPCSRVVFTFHRPEELARLVDLPGQLRTGLREMPPLVTGDLWQVQEEAITNLEMSLAENRSRALIQMATGSGKTFTACNFCYRLIKFAGAKRVLFLVDRNNLGKQTENEFQQFVSPYNNMKFTEEYAVQRLRKNTIDPAAKVCITTIQRLYSMLSGEEEYEEGNEEDSMFESDSSSISKEPVSVEYNPKVPIETFDFIVIDECHRSIYNIWRQVLDYFDAFLIGLTATPTKQTIGFFNNNLVQDYSHERAVADGVNVTYDVFRIETEITANGAKLKKEPDYLVPRRDRRTREKRYEALNDDLIYTPNQLDRDVVSLDQIRTVIRTFRRCLPVIFPGRTEVPKTLVFAKTDLHAEDIVRTIREEFGKGNDFCQKITSKSTAAPPDVLLANFRNSYNPRIAVTVDMIATGTDVKPLECLLFMRNIASASYFEQMKGRGCRVVKKDDLKMVTPDADAKDRFVIVDAVGVCETDKTHSKPLDRKKSVPLDKLLKMAAQGRTSPDLASTLAARLARLDREIDDDQRSELATLAGKPLPCVTAELLTSIDPDAVVQRATQANGLSPGQEPTQEQYRKAERDAVREALKPFHNPKLRDRIIAIKSSLEQVIDEVTTDKVLRAGMDDAARERARGVLANFRQFIEDNKDEIEALTILYSRPHRAGLRFSQVKELAKSWDP